MPKLPSEPNRRRQPPGYINEMNLEDCLLAELSQGVSEDPDELRFALEQSKRFVVDDDHVVEKTVVQRVFDVMESDIETRKRFPVRAQDSSGQRH